MTKSTLVTSWIMKEIDKVENDIKKKIKKSISGNIDSSLSLRKL